MMFDCMKVINEARVPADAVLGTVVIENILGTGANVVTTRNVKI